VSGQGVQARLGSREHSLKPWHHLDRLRRYWVRGGAASLISKSPVGCVLVCVLGFRHRRGRWRLAERLLDIGASLAPRTAVTRFRLVLNAALLSAAHVSVTIGSDERSETRSREYKREDENGVRDHAFLSRGYQGAI